MFGESIHVFDSKSVIYSAWFSTLCSGSNFTNFWNKSCISSWQVLNSVAFGCNFKRIWYFAQNYLYLKLYNSLHPDNKAEFFLNLFIFFWAGWSQQFFPLSRKLREIFGLSIQYVTDIFYFKHTCIYQIMHEKLFWKYRTLYIMKKYTPIVFRLSLIFSLFYFLFKFIYSSFIN